MPIQTDIPFTVRERASAILSWNVEDEDGQAVSNAAIETMTLTLYDVSSNTIINSRNDQDILGPGKTGINNVDITSGGSVTWYLQPDDNIIVNSSAWEYHTALIEWTWNPGDGKGSRQGRQEVPILVENLNRVP
jgi:hypothetical protein